MRLELARIVAVAAVLTAGVLALAGPGARHADAHPLGNFTVNRYARIELYRDAVHLHYVLDFAEIPTFQLLETIDRDRDGRASAQELDAYRVKLEQQLPERFELRVGAARAAVRPLAGEAQLLPGQGGLDVLRVALLYAAPAPAGATDVQLHFADRNYDDRLGWKEIVVRPSEGARAVIDAALTRDTTNALREYPSTALNSALDVRSVAFSWAPGTGAAAPAETQLASGTASRPTDRFGALLSRNQSLGVVFASLLAAFGFGALHALGPGHGKAMIAAYLVGSRGTVRHAFALGLTVTATHTSMVYLLGFVTIAVSAFIVPERLYLYLGLASGVSVVVMGAGLFAARLRRLRRRHEARSGHEPVHPHDHGHEHGHEHPHTHTHEERVTWRSLLTLGVAGGLLPCPSALLVMLAAISLGQALYGMLLIVAFSAGLAGVLTAVGVALVVSRHATRRLAFARRVRAAPLARAAAALPTLSALGVAVAGLVITYQALQQFGA